jgi:hypothetical protein
MWERTSTRREDMKRKKVELIGEAAKEEFRANMVKVGYDRAESALFTLQDLGSEIPTRILDRELTKLLPGGVRQAILDSSASATAFARQTERLLDEARAIAEGHVEALYAEQERERLKNTPHCDKCGSVLPAKKAKKR